MLDCYDFFIFLLLYFSYSVAMVDAYEKCFEWSNTCEMASSNNIERELNKTDFWKVFLTPEKSCRPDKSQQITFQPDCSCMNHTKTARRRRFKSQSGFYLAILPNGKVIGTKDEQNRYCMYTILLLLI